MGQIEKLVKDWIEERKYPFIHEGVDSITKAIQNYINICDTLPIEDKIKAFSYLHEKCDYILNSIASFMNYQLEYEPTEDEIWNFVEQEKGYIDVKIDPFNYERYVDESVIYENVIEPMREQYIEKNKDASEWCDKIREMQTDIYKRIRKEKGKQLFINEIFKANNKTVKTTIDECLINCNINTIKPKLSRLLRGNKGNNVAYVIKALETLEYTAESTKTLFRIFKSELGVEGEYNGVTEGLRLMDGYKNDPEYKKGEEHFKKMVIVMKELEQ